MISCSSAFLSLLWSSQGGTHLGDEARPLYVNQAQVHLLGISWPITHQYQALDLQSLNENAIQFPLKVPVGLFLQMLWLSCWMFVPFDVSKICEKAHLWRPQWIVHCLSGELQWLQGMSSHFDLHLRHRKKKLSKKQKKYSSYGSFFHNILGLNKLRLTHLAVAPL